MTQLPLAVGFALLGLTFCFPQLQVGLVNSDYVYFSIFCNACADHLSVRPFMVSNENTSLEIDKIFLFMESCVCV